MRTVLVLVTLLSACASSPRYLAKVNGDTITRHELRAEFKRRHGGHEKFLGEAGMSRQFLDRVIDRRLLLQEAYRIGLDKRPEIVALRAREEEKRALEELKKREIDEKARPTSDEIKAVYETKTATLFEARQIVTTTREDAEAIRAELAAGGDFEKLARTRSVGHSARYGGRLPPLGWGAQDPAWEEVVFALEPGELSPVFEVAGTFEVVELVEKKTVDKPPFANAAEAIKGILTKRMKADRERAFADELWAKYHVQRATLELGPEAFARPAAEQSTTPVATWDGGGKLTLADLAASLPVEGLASLSPARRTITIDRALRQLVYGELAAKEARARHLEKDPEVALAVNDVVEDGMEGLLYNEFILKDVTVTDEEIAKHYDEHKADLMTEETRLISHILVPTKEAAVELRKRIDAGERFADLARSSSTDRDSAEKGGSLGPVTRKEVPPDLLAVLDLKEGEVSEPLQTKFGWHLMKILTIVAPRQQTLDEVRDDLRAKIKKRKVDEQRGFWVARLRADAKIEVRDAELRKLANEVLVEPESKRPQTPHPSPAGHTGHGGTPAAPGPH